MALVFRKLSGFSVATHINFILSQYKMARYYIDTCIWIDIINERKGFAGEDLAGPALKLLEHIMKAEGTIVISDAVMQELVLHVAEDAINSILAILHAYLEYIEASAMELEEMKRIAIQRKLPYKDVLHAVISRNRHALLVTRDKHFKHLEDICKHYLPEELIQ